jgi:predicted Ser/Thr protein kinase
MAMPATHLVELLHAVLRGEAHFQDLVARVDEALAESPAQTAGFEVELDALYARNEIRYDVYLHLKDRCSRGAPRPATITGPTGRDPAVTALRPATGQSPAAPAPADRTMLRSPGSTAPRSTPPNSHASHPASRPPSLPTGGSHTGAPWGEAFDQTLVIEPPLDRGTRVKDRFVLEERLGEGGMGVVFKARDLRKEEAQDRDPYVAIKFLNSEFRRHPESLKALQRETRRAQTLAHPNVVTVYDFDRDGTLIYMTMEYLAGEPLDLHIKRHAQGLRFRDAWPIIEGAGRALMYAHEQGVIHADFKPSNVFVSDKKAKVLDFGIARAMQAQIGGADGTRFDAGTLGALTPAYASWLA